MSSVKVAVRVRPFNQREIGNESKCIIGVTANTTTINGRDLGKETHSFNFDHSYWSFSKNDSHFTTQKQVSLCVFIKFFLEISPRVRSP
ncbi:unnamed protein product [Caenorhabditis auriculariae]|uniref:Kinesin motor domain-containing protein n=1 Tax=Caenorhabditis auriculariae TaxID=2777116 RepID=A0A8S1HXL0_9PELO|nr:unnamed protein product [Caenorhabditis auriculariae]